MCLDGHKKRAYPHDFHSRLKPLALKATKALNKLYGTKYVSFTHKIITRLIVLFRQLEQVQISCMKLPAHPT